MAEFYFDKTLRLTSGAGKFFSVSQQNKFIAGLFALCAVLWVLAAIHPLDRQAWALENILLVLFVATLALVRRRLQLSNASYIFIALFVVLHIIGAHYTYAKMPLGLWAKGFFGFSRNHLDRVAHFGFGFLLKDRELFHVIKIWTITTARLRRVGSSDWLGYLMSERVNSSLKDLSEI